MISIFSVIYLHSDDADGGDGAKGGLQRGEGDDEPDDGAVGVADEEALVQAVDGALVGDEVEVRQVDGGHDERHEGIAAVVFGVGEDGDFSLEESHFCNHKSVNHLLSSVCLSLSCECEKRTNIASDIGIEAAKHHVAVGKLLRAALPHDHLGDVANGRGLLPPHGILVLLACGAGRGADCVQLEGRVALQEEDEALADGAGAAEDA